MADSDWVKQRLPAGTTSETFSKNGVSTTLSAAVDAALASHAGQTEAKMLALADLLEVIIANQQFKHERDGDYEYDMPLLQSRADSWRERAASGAAMVPGSFGFVTATFGAADVSDENSQT